MLTEAQMFQLSNYLFNNPKIKNTSKVNLTDFKNMLQCDDI